MMQLQDGRPRSGRRALLRGAAWVTPVAMSSVAAPAVAASSSTVSGSANISSNCSTSGTNATQTLGLSETAAYPTFGFWMDSVPSGSTPTNARFTIYFSTSFGTLTWTRTSASTWSLPTVDATAPAISGYTAYTTTYSGAWTYDSQRRRYRVNGVIGFQAVRRSLSCIDPVTIHTLRRVTWNGQAYSLRRGPSNLVTS